MHTKTKIFKFTKRSYEWGLDGVNIKLGKKFVGSISYNRKLGCFKVVFSVLKKELMEDGNPNCDWRNVRLTAKFSTLEAAKTWVLANQKTIQEKYNLREMDSC